LFVKLFTRLIPLVVLGILAPNSPAFAVDPTPSDPASYVNPFFGTQKSGRVNVPGNDAANTFPGAVAPFGMTQFSPDTVKSAIGGYDYDSNQVKGFSLTHMSGVGCPQGQDLPFIPFSGDVASSPVSSPSTYYSTFSHDKETAQPGYYGTQFTNGVHAELTSTTRTGFGRFAYPAGSAASLLVGGSYSSSGNSVLTLDPPAKTVSGSVSSGNFCGGGNKYTMYFTVQFDRAFTTSGTWQAKTLTPNTARTTTSVHSGGAYISFPAQDKTQTVQARVGISYVSVANAAANLKAEQGTSTFDAVRAATYQQWRDRLASIAVSGATKDRYQVFYTALYHSLLMPNVFSDVNGQYVGFDNKVRSVKSGHAHYANFSGWDIYRSEAQLLALLFPHEASDIAQSLYDQASQAGGIWDRWSVNNDFEGVMNGDPYHIIVATMQAFGATDFDAKGALTSMVKGATKIQNPSTARFIERPGLKNYLDKGYVSGDPSTTIEYNAADFAIAQLAQSLGDTATHDTFMGRAQSWLSTFNLASGQLEPRDRAGFFPTSVAPNAQDGYIEGNAAQYVWQVPFNPAGLVEALGGVKAASAKLDTYFSQLNAGTDKPYAFFGNEPTLLSPYVYDYVGQPAKAQDVIFRALTTLYTADPVNLAGNDDAGTMSSWYVWNSLGLAPSIPGTSVLTATSPLFDHAAIHRGNGVTITMSAAGASAGNRYIDGVSVNGAATQNVAFDPTLLTKGGTVAFTLGATASNWGTVAPPTFATGMPSLAATPKPGTSALDPRHKSATSMITVHNFTDATTQPTWKAVSPQGISLDKASGTVTVPAHATVTFPITATAATNVEGVYDIPVTIGDVTTGLRVQYTNPGSFFAATNNTGFGTNDTDANYDTLGSAYSVAALKQTSAVKGNDVTANGFSFPLAPNFGKGTADNVTVADKPMTFAVNGSGSQLSFLGSATNGDTDRTITIAYADGTTSDAKIGFTDWTMGGSSSTTLSYGNVVAVSMPYRMSTDGPTTQQLTTNLYATQPISLNPTKKITSVTINGGTTSVPLLHVFSAAVK
jgi:predicted alpha-1,2-mannosidase